MNMSVLLSVANLGSHTTKLHQILCILTVAVGWSFVMRYILPVLWMTSFFNNVPFAAFYVYSEVGIGQRDDQNCSINFQLDFAQG